jgi:alkaline phosphatase D
MLPLSLVTRCVLLFSCIALGGVAIADESENYGQFAPPDAFENGSSLAYYGSENEWGPRQFTAEEADLFYKRLGQRQLLLIMEGQIDEAIQSCRAHIAKDPHDLESLFTLTIAQCRLGDLDAAFATMQQAIAAGLPLERFLAGPRDLLAPLISSRKFQDYLAQHPVTLIHGPMLGAVTDHSARFWLRTTQESDVNVRIFDHESDTKPSQAAGAKARAETDYTTVVEVSGLKPDTTYFYDLAIDGTPLAREKRNSFRTFPTGSAQFRIAFGGCAGHAPQNERMWDLIASYHPLAMLLTGDNVYIDLPREAGPLHNYTMYVRQSRPEFRRLIASTPIYAIWDDHDAGVDDIWLGPYRDKPSWKPSMLKLFQHNWNNPAYGSAEWPGCWYNFDIGDVELFMLDCRYYRTNPFADARTMLGPVQKKWLLDALKRSQAKFKFIVSSVAWGQGAKPGSRDTWDGFPEEREEIFSWIERNAINGVVLLSGDRHRSEAWKIDRPDAYPLYDFLSARLTNVDNADLVPGPLFSYNEKCTFGLLSIDTTAPDPAVTYQIINIDGEILYTLKLTKSELTMPQRRQPE